MTRRTISVFVANALLLIAFSGIALAQWTDDGALFRTSSYTVSHQAMVPDNDQGGYFVQIVHSLTEAIETSRFDSHGNILWTQIMHWPAGVTTVSNPLAAADGSGGVLVAFVGNIGGLNSLFINRYDTTGALLYGPGTKCSGTTPVFTPALAVEPDGTAYLAWNTVSGSGGTIYCQKVDPAGGMVWNTHSVQVTTSASVNNDVQITTDGIGGLYAVWTDNRFGNVDIYGQRMDSTGNAAWGTSGLAVCSDMLDQNYPILLLDDSGGCMFFWIDYRSGFAVYGQQISATGSAEWAANGVSVASNNSGMLGLCGVTNGHGGASVFWRDYSTSPISIAGQGVDTNGNPQWILPTGKTVIQSAYTCSLPYAVAYDGGAWVGCAQYVDSQYDLFVQKVNWGGGYSLDLAGEPFCSAPGEQYTFAMGPDGHDGAFVSWIDQRNGRNDAYAQRITNVEPAYGYAWFGYPGAGIVSVDDVPGDQGGFIRLRFSASPLDQFPDNPITSYTLWRTFAPWKMADTNAVWLADPSDLLPDMKGPVRWAESAGDKVTYWELMSVETPYAQPGYARVLPTPYDSTAVYSDPVIYRILTHTADPQIYWEASTALGLSIDNLSPAAPMGLAGTASYSPPEMQLSWLPNDEQDLAGYSLYRGSSDDFVLDEAHLVAEPEGTSYTDPDWTEDTRYRLVARDVHGNVGPSTLLALGQMSAVGDRTPGAFAVLPCVPNPFNPSTTIRFETPDAGSVDLLIFDASGRLVRRLVDGEIMKAGLHARAWDGRTDAGQRAASGVYLYRVVAGEHSGVGRMVLVK